MKTSVRQINKDDFDIVLNLWSNALVRKHLGGIVSKEKIDKSFSNMILKNSSENKYLVIEYKNVKIGIVSIDDYYLPNTKEISYQFLPEYWNKGLAFSTLSQILNDLRVQDYKYIQIFAETQRSNLRSCKLLEKLNFENINTIERYGEVQSVYRLFLSKG